MGEQHSLRQAAAAVGVTYSQAWHAYAYGRLPWSRRVGRTFILYARDIDALTEYFRAGRVADADHADHGPWRSQG